MHPYVFETRFYALRWENVLILLAIAAALWLAHRRAAPKGRAYQELILDLALWQVAAGIIGGRIWDVAFSWSDYAGQPLRALEFWNGGMSIQGCVLGGLIAALVFARRHQVRIWDLLDVLAPPVLLGQAIGRIGCLTSGDAFGRPIADVPWLPQWLGVVYSPKSPAGFIFGAIPLIPAEAMEGAGDLLILALLLWYVPKHAVPGRTVLTYAILYSGLRFGLEYFRADSLMLGQVKVAQLLSLVVIFVSGALLALQYRHSLEKTKAAGL